MSKLMPLVSLLAACGAPRPLIIQVDKSGHASAWREMASLTEEINTRAECRAVTMVSEQSHAPAPELASVAIHWATWPEMADYFDLAPDAGGVSTRDDKRIWIATEELPPELSQSGLLSDCEIGYLWVFWVGRLAGLQTQYTDPSHITYGHPDCQDGKPNFDWVGDLLEQLDKRNLSICS